MGFFRLTSAISSPASPLAAPRRNQMLRIAIPNKGRLSEDARELFTDAGLEVRVRGDRALTASLGGEFEAIFVRAQDIPEFVADGAADAGVTGWDLVCESERPLDALLDLGFGRCRIVLAAKDDGRVRVLDDLRDLRRDASEGRAVESDAPRAPVRVATVFPRVTRRWFERAGHAVDL